MRAKIENKSVLPVSKDELSSLIVTLTKYGKAAEDCRRGDCFSSSYQLKNLNKLKNGESLELEINLANLYWKDIISSLYNFNEPKNMPEVIRPGSYYLSMSLSSPAANSTKQNPRVMEIKSNKILVRVL